MKTIKFLSIGVAVLLASCGSTSKMISTPAENIDMTPMKTTKLSENDLQRWSHLDLVKDTVPGMSVDKAYAEILKGKKGQKVIVGIVDSGIDINHEDLKAVIWKNPKEIPNNKKDDDKNGYVDDINGWNFLGNSNDEQLEKTRIVKKGPSSPDYAKAKAELDAEIQGLQGFKQQVDYIVAAEKALEDHLKSKNFTRDEVKAIVTEDAKLIEYRDLFVNQILVRQTKAEFDERLKKQADYVYDQLNYNLNVDFDGRKVVGDNPEDLNDKNYGNNNVVGPDPEDALHGTHVAGIVAQVRGNGKGGDGVANNVQIMAVRAVPNGDEYDKDIALGIRYAVDNGAKIINGSFGKYYSPHKEWVIDALKYAASKDVLVIFAAGNDSKNLDVENKYPSDSYDGAPEVSNNVLIVGALNVEYGNNMVAPFSNYGKKNVDVFAPGMKIYATTPNNTYQYLQGTSMASPNVAGVAALIRSYYPKLTAAQVKQILIESGTPLKNDILIGEEQSKANFSEISKSGKIVNAYNALVMASKM